jgi:hypothetical protein
MQTCRQTHRETLRHDEDNIRFSHLFSFEVTYRKMTVIRTDEKADVYACRKHYLTHLDRINPNILPYWWTSLAITR